MRERMLNNAVDIIKEVTLLCQKRTEAVCPHPERTLQSIDTAIAETEEMLTEAIAFQALSELAKLRFPSPVEIMVIDQTAEELVTKITSGQI